jgi:hypothetical protein
MFCFGARRYMEGLDKGKGMYFLFIKSETRTPGGLLARPVLTSYYKSQHFRERPYDPYNVYTSPIEAILCADSIKACTASFSAVLHRTTRCSEWEPCSETLDFYSGGLPQVCTMYASSECYFGINLKPLCKSSEVSYTLMPNMAFFEFLPVYRNNDDAAPVTMATEQQELVDLADVTVGQEYELVITTYAGIFCRFSTRFNLVLLLCRSHPKLF